MVLFFATRKKKLCSYSSHVKCSLDSLASFAADDIAMMETFQKLSPNLKRGTAKPVETRFKCCNSGFNADRGGPGIVLTNNCRDEEANHTKQLKHLCCKCQKLMGKFLPTQDLRALSSIKAIVPFPTLAGPDSESIFPTASMAVDYCSAAHADKDFFTPYSLSGRPITTGSILFMKQIQTSPHPPLNILSFRLSVSLWLIRPGDHLIFNPQIPHCCSEKLIEYTTHRVYLCAFYLKTAIIGMNDNSLPLTSLQEKSKGN